MYDTVYINVGLGNEKKCISAVIVYRLPQKISTIRFSEATERLSQNGGELETSCVNGDSVGSIKRLIGSDYYASFVKGMVWKYVVTLLKTGGSHVMYGKLPRPDN